MKSVVASSGILVLASHSERLIENECNMVLRLERGRIVEFQPRQAEPLTQPFQSNPANRVDVMPVAA